MPLPHLQELIHKFEVGPGGRVVRLVLVALTVLLVWVGYNWRSYRNLSSPEAMDACQLGRNLAEGRGFSTFVVRPFSVYLLANHRRADTNAPAAPPPSPERVAYPPDLSTPPAYRRLLAGLMKVLPFNY